MCVERMVLMIRYILCLAALWLVFFVAIFTAIYTPADVNPVPEKYYCEREEVAPTRTDVIRKLAVLESSLDFYDVYRENYFDCSEMSSYLEWYFERSGYKTDIVIGHTGNGSRLSHAWVRIHGENNSLIMVEATCCEVLPQYWYESEYHEEMSLSNIYKTDNTLFCIDEFDWWNTSYADQLRGVAV